MKCFFSLRSLAWLGAGFVLLCLLVVWIENWTGARALAAAKLKLEQAGETLDLAELRPKPIPDVSNFCAIEPLVGITVEDEERKKAFSNLDWSRWSWEKHRTLLPQPTLGKGCRLGLPFDFQQAAAYLREVTYIDSPADASPAQVLASIDRLHPLLKELSDAAPSRSEAVFLPQIGLGYKGPPGKMPVPHMDSAQCIARGLALRAHVAAAAGDAESAVNSIQASMRLTQAVGKEPTMLWLLVALTTSTYELNSIWSLLHRHAATEPQLARLQSDLERQDFMESTLLAVRGELAFQITSIEWYKQRGIRSNFIPAGWFDHNAATTIQLHSTWLLEPFKEGDVGQINRGFDELEQILGERSGITSPHYLLPRLSLPGYLSVVRMAIYCEAVRRQALAAIAIERHRLVHGQLPARLDELVPSFLSAVPLDPMDRQPMRYRVEGNAFTLWSIAMDCHDDHGKLPTAKEARHIDRTDYAGDWVWKN